MINTTERRALQLTPLRRRMFEILVSRQFVGKESMVTHVWGDDPDGGPDDPLRNIDVQMVYLRRYLDTHGVIVETKRGVGWRIPPHLKDSARRLLAAESGAGWSTSRCRSGSASGMLPAEAVMQD